MTVKLIIDIEAVNNATAALDELKGLLNANRRLLRNTTSLKWGTRYQVARSLRYILNMRRSWLQIRLKFTRAETMIRALTKEFDQRIIHAAGPLHRTTTRRRRYGKTYIGEEKSVKAHEFESRFPGKDDHELVYERVQEWRELCKQADLDYAQSEQLMLSIPAYMDIKHLMPRNGRAAYSAIMACNMGKLSRNYADQNKLFGWGISIDGPYTNKSLPINLRRVIKAISARVPEKGGPAPSFKTGCELLSSQQTDTVRPAKLSSAERFEPIRTKYNELITTYSLCGLWLHCSASHLRFLRSLDENRLSDRQIRINHKIAMKVMCAPGESGSRCQNDVVTTLTGSIVHHSGNDYYAPCIYSEQVYDGPSWDRRVRGTKMSVGYVLMRRAWPDLIHVKAADFNPDRITSMLDQASFAFFQAKLDAAERARLGKLTQAEREKMTKVRKAKIIKSLRALFMPITRADSYAVQNCVPGTEAFITQLKHYSTIKEWPEDGGIEGRELARCWRKANYIQIDRFSNVVRRMEQMQADHLRRCYEAVTALFPVEIVTLEPVDTWGTDQYPSHAVITDEHQPTDETRLDGTGRYEPFAISQAGERRLDQDDVPSVGSGQEDFIGDGTTDQRPANLSDPAMV